LRDVMLSAGECGAWLTLRELSRLTLYGEASISAQLRHLRKPEFGAFVVEKQRRFDAVFGAGEEHGVVWEYQLSRGTRRHARRVELRAPKLSASAQLERQPCSC
jgi:hypothetical protein